MVASETVVAPPLSEATVTWDADALKKHHPRKEGGDNGSWYQPGNDALLTRVRSCMKQPERWHPGDASGTFVLVLNQSEAADFRTPRGNTALRAEIVLWPSGAEDVKPVDEADYAIVSVKASTHKCCVDRWRARRLNRRRVTSSRTAT